MAYCAALQNKCLCYLSFIANDLIAFSVNIDVAWEQNVPFTVSVDRKNNASQNDKLSHPTGIQ